MKAVLLDRHGPPSVLRVREVPSPEPSKGTVRVRVRTIGLNYADHVAESGMDTPQHPTIFNKQSTCVVGPDAPVHVPRASHVLDYEGELGFVIGRRCRHVSREDAPDVIAGYTVVNDVSVRDFQSHTAQFMAGKAWERTTPVGPHLVVAEPGDSAVFPIRLHFSRDTTVELLRLALPMVVSQGTFAVMIFTDRYFMSQIDPVHMAAALGGGVASFFSFCFFVGLFSYANAMAAPPMPRPPSRRSVSGKGRPTTAL